MSNVHLLTAVCGDTVLKGKSSIHNASPSCILDMVGRAGLEPASPKRETGLQPVTLPITIYLPMWCCERDLNSQNCVPEMHMYADPITAAYYGGKCKT